MLAASLVDGKDYACSLQLEITASYDGDAGPNTGGWARSAGDNFDVDLQTQFGPPRVMLPLLAGLTRVASYFAGCSFLVS